MVTHDWHKSAVSTATEWMTKSGAENLGGCASPSLSLFIFYSTQLLQLPHNESTSQHGRRRRRR